MLKSFEIPLCVQEVGQKFQVWILWLEENTHIQQFWSEFYRNMYDLGQCCKEIMCKSPLKRFQPVDSNNNSNNNNNNNNSNNNNNHR